VARLVQATGVVASTIDFDPGFLVLARFSSQQQCSGELPQRTAQTWRFSGNRHARKRIVRITKERIKTAPGTPAFQLIGPKPRGRPLELDGAFLRYRITTRHFGGRLPESQLFGDALSAEMIVQWIASASGRDVLHFGERVPCQI
jgi:hypothetical protein